jgi:uncharacterized protein with HEPN domain
MSRHDRLYLNDRVQSCEKILVCTEGLDRQALESDWIRFDAVLRNLEILGEAAKGVSEAVRQKHPDIPWRKIGGMRDIVSHHYFGLDKDAIWDAVKNRVPELLVSLRRIRDSAEDRI